MINLFKLNYKIILTDLWYSYRVVDKSDKRVKFEILIKNKLLSYIYSHI